MRNFVRICRGGKVKKVVHISKLHAEVMGNNVYLFVDGDPISVGTKENIPQEDLDAYIEWLFGHIQTTGKIEAPVLPKAPWEGKQLIKENEKEVF